MSFLNLVSTSVDGIVHEFLNQVSSTYNISIDDLKVLWNNNDKINLSIKENAPVQKMTNDAELNNLSKTELQNHCKVRGLKVTGTKQEMISRLTGVPLSAIPSKPKPKSKSKKSVEPTVQPKVIKTLQSQIHLVKIEKNSFGNFVHSDTQFVFDRVSQQVTGKQNINGSIELLTVADIEICNKYKFKYVLPNNLKSTTEAVVVDELEDDNEDDHIGDIIEEEELESDPYENASDLDIESGNDDNDDNFAD